MGREEEGTKLSCRQLCEHTYPVLLHPPPYGEARKEGRRKNGVCSEHDDFSAYVHGACIEGEKRRGGGGKEKGGEG